MSIQTQPSASKAECYFSEAEEAFETAVSATADIRRYFRMGDNVLCLRFAGSALEKSLTESLSHIEVPPTEASLLINCWDSASTSTFMPRPPWPSTAYGAKGRITGFNDDTIRTVYQPGVDILHMYNAERRTGLYWMQHPGILPYWEVSFPMRCIIHWWCRQQPYQLVHAGAVGFNDGGVLLTGKSGSGKSTTALACLNSPLEYAGDDYVLTKGGSNPFVYSLYNSAKLVPEGIGQLPHLASKVSNPTKLQNEKALLFLNAHFPEKLSPGFPIKAIFLPHITREKETRLRPATQMQALAALAPTSILHLEGDSRLAFDKMSALVKLVPSYWLDVGSNLDSIPGVITRFLRGCYG